MHICPSTLQSLKKEEKSRVHSFLFLELNGLIFDVILLPC